MHRRHNIVGDDNGGCVKLFGVHLETQRNDNSMKKSLALEILPQKMSTTMAREFIGVSPIDGPTRRA
jgi:hypothetical protein